MYIFNVLLKGENSLKELLQCYRQAPCAETLNLSPYVDCVYFTKHMVTKKSKQASQPFEKLTEPSTKLTRYSAHTTH